MPSILVKVEPSILRWALNQIDVGSIDESLIDNINKWIAGDKIPTFNQIEELSKKTRIPLGYFFLKEVPEESIKLLDFRTVDSKRVSKPSRELIDTISDMERIRDWLQDYRKQASFGPCEAVGVARDMNKPQDIASVMRKYMDINLNWYEETANLENAFAYIREKSNNVGITVMMNGIVRNNTRRSLDIDEFRAFAIVDEIAPVIFINGADSQGARVFSLFHELAHVFIGENDFFNDRQYKISKVSPTEQLCNAVASELMVPERAFSAKWDSISIKDPFEKISRLAKEFRCGRVVIARKALDNGKIKSDTYNQIVEKAIELYNEAKATKRSGGGDFYNTLASRTDKSLLRCICAGLSEEKITYSEAFQLTNTNMKTFPELALRLGGIQNW